MADYETEIKFNTIFFPSYHIIHIFFKFVQTKIFENSDS